MRLRVLIDCSRGAMRLAATGHIRNLAPEQLAVVTFDGDPVEGAIEPVAREIVGMHACVYRERDDVHAVIHTHSPRATSFALAHKPPAGGIRGLPALQHHRGGSGPAVLLDNHGLLAFLWNGVTRLVRVGREHCGAASAAPDGSRDALAAAQLIVIMEVAAELLLDTNTLGGAKPFPADALERERRHMQHFGLQR